jgi:hypothetical protein
MIDRETIIRLAREAGIPIETDWAGRPSTLVVKDGGTYLRGVDDLERLAALIEDNITFSSVHTCSPGCTKPACVARQKAVEAEREACAKVADLVAREIDDTNGTATYIAAAIRSRA